MYKLQLFLSVEWYKEKVFNEAEIFSEVATLAHCKISLRSSIETTEEKSCKTPVRTVGFSAEILAGTSQIQSQL
jgi:hypothetical protein